MSQCPPMASTPPPMMTTAEAARALNVSTRTVQRWAENGLLPKPVRLGGSTLRFPRAAFEKWIEDGCPNPQASQSRA